ncbi:antibiotic biosynthesis monooxygenase [Moniliophthora roreri]|nr:antibiotic biosynthesis monooxygenase [Moniliophthora roreri]
MATSINTSASSATSSLNSPLDLSNAVNSLIVTLFNMADSLPANFNGIFNLLVQITAASGKEEELARHLAAVAKSSDSSKEPGTLLLYGYEKKRMNT